MIVAGVQHVHAHKHNSNKHAQTHVYSHTATHKQINAHTRTHCLPEYLSRKYTLRPKGWLAELASAHDKGLDRGANAVWPGTP